MALQVRQRSERSLDPNVPSEHTEREMRVVAGDGAQQMLRLVTRMVAAPTLVILGLPATARHPIAPAATRQARARL